MTKIKVFFSLVTCLVVACSSLFSSRAKSDGPKEGNEKSEVSKNIDASNSSQGVNLDEYVFYFGDEFNDNAVDTKIWNRRRRLPTDLFSYDPNTLPTIKVSDGILHMTTYNREGEIGSAEISTDRHFWLRYGYLELRAKLSSGVGNECAFWLQTPKTLVVSNPFNPAVAGTEIDIFENGIAKGGNKLYYSLHWNGYNAPDAKFVTFADSIPGVYNGFHTFAFEWTPKKYTVYVDGKQRATSDTIISHTPESIILGIGPGGFGGSAPMFPNPSSFLVDYLRVYKRRPEVTLYGNVNYRKWVSDGLLQGSYTTAQLIEKGCRDNSLSSIEIPSGWKVILYDKDNFSGDSLVINSGDVSDLGAFNNITSSIRIEGP